MACSAPNVLAVKRFDDGYTKSRFIGPYTSEAASEFFRRTYRADISGFIVNWYLTPCRSCLACRKLRALHMATRCMLEMKYYREEYDLPSSFITLTYNDDFLPRNGSLEYRHFQLFIKSYRRWLERREGRSFKFYMCGEYGKRLQRPHYHAIIFGHLFSDLQYIDRREHGHTVYTSPSLSSLWKRGYVTVGEASIASARYVASYIHKKDYGPRRDEHYGDLIPEFTNGSKRPGIGLEWLKLYWPDVMASDDLIVDGVRYPISDYYTRKLSEMFPASMADVRRRRALANFDRLDNLLLSGESDLANRHRNGKFLEILHSNSFRRSYESVCSQG